MKITSTMIVLIVATLGVIAMLRTEWERKPLSPWERGWGEGARRVLEASQLPIDEVTRITLKRAGESPLVFEKSQSAKVDGAASWNQTQPFAHPMEMFSIRQLAQQALELEAIDAVEPARLSGGAGAGMSPQALGLSPPLAEIMYEWSGGSLTLRLGRRSVAGRAYLQIAGDEKMYIVSPALHERATETDPKEWRSRTIFSLVNEVGGLMEPDRIEWRNEPAKMTLRRERKTWMMAEPVRTRLDPSVRDQYLDAIARAQVSGFVFDQPAENDLSKFGLQDGRVSLTVTSNGGTTGQTIQRLIIGNRAGGPTQDYFGMIEGRPVIVRISGAVLAALFRQATDLAALTGSGVNPADVKAIAIRHGEDEVRLQRDLEKWRGASLRAGPSPAQAMPDQQMRDVNAAHAQELLEQLTQLRGTGVEFAERYPRELEVATITLHGYDGKALDTVRIIHDEQSGRWAMENGDNVLRIFPASVKLRLSAADFGL
jgi:hypothetical protein